MFILGSGHSVCSVRGAKIMLISSKEIIAIFRYSYKFIAKYAYKYEY